jgi:integral membrane protein
VHVRYERPPVLELLQTFRRIAWLEGISFLLLLGIAMPLKYWAGMPAAVRVVGSLHGLLFIAYGVSALLLLTRGHWSFGRASLAMLASVVPFGTFLFDAWLQRES